MQILSTCSLLGKRLDKKKENYKNLNIYRTKKVF